MANIPFLIAGLFTKRFVVVLAENWKSYITVQVEASRMNDYIQISIF